VILLAALCLSMYVFPPLDAMAARAPGGISYLDDGGETGGKLPAPTIEWPTATDIRYGQQVAASALIGGSTQYGSFQWAPADAGLSPSAGTYRYTVHFTPSADTQNNYEPIVARSARVGLTVLKADPAVVFPTTSPVMEFSGLRLSAVPLDGGSGDGSFAWSDPDIAPAAPGGLFDVVFTPNDTANYNTVTRRVYLTVISDNVQDEEHYDSTYTANTLSIRVGVLGGKWKTLKTYNYMDIWRNFEIYDQMYSWIDNGSFLILQAVRGVYLWDLLEDAMNSDGVLYPNNGAVQVMYFHCKDKGYYINMSPDSLFGVDRFYFPNLAGGWDFAHNNYPYGDYAAWEGAQPVSPVIALEEYRHRVNDEVWRDPNAYWDKITSGARFRLAWGMPSPTSRTGHDSAKYIDRIDLVLNATMITGDGPLGDYYGEFTEEQDPAPDEDDPVPAAPGEPYIGANSFSYALKDARALTEAGVKSRSGVVARDADGNAVSAANITVDSAQLAAIRGATTAGGYPLSFTYAPGGGGRAVTANITVTLRGDGSGDGTGTGDGSGPGSGSGKGDGSGSGSGSKTGAGGSAATSGDHAGQGTSVGIVRQSGENGIVELVLSDGRTVEAVELDTITPTGVSPDFNASSILGADLLRAGRLTMLETVGGGGDGSEGGGSEIKPIAVPLSLPPIDTRIFAAVLSVLAASFALGGLSAYLTGRNASRKGALLWIRAR
jgi:hypothetical protein